MKLLTLTNLTKDSVFPWKHGEMFAQHPFDLNVSLVGCRNKWECFLEPVCLTRLSFYSIVYVNVALYPVCVGSLLMFFQVFKGNLFCLVNFTECHDVSYNDLFVAHGKLLCSLTTNHMDCGCCMLNQVCFCASLPWIYTLIINVISFYRISCQIFYLLSYAALQSAMSRITFLWLRCLIFVL
jgi:hypothetical protein